MLKTRNIGNMLFYETVYIILLWRRWSVFKYCYDLFRRREAGEVFNLYSLLQRRWRS